MMHYHHTITRPCVCADLPHVAGCLHRYACRRGHGSCPDGRQRHYQRCQGVNAFFFCMGYPGFCMGVATLPGLGKVPVYTHKQHTNAHVDILHVQLRRKCAGLKHALGPRLCPHTNRRATAPMTTLSHPSLGFIPGTLTLSKSLCLLSPMALPGQGLLSSHLDTHMLTIGAQGFAADCTSRGHETSRRPLRVLDKVSGVLKPVCVGVHSGWSQV